VLLQHVSFPVFKDWDQSGRRIDIEDDIAMKAFAENSAIGKKSCILKGTPEDAQLLQQLFEHLFGNARTCCECVEFGKHFQMKHRVGTIVKCLEVCVQPRNWRDSDSKEWCMTQQKKNTANDSVPTCAHSTDAVVMEQLQHSVSHLQRQITLVKERLLEMKQTEDLFVKPFFKVSLWH
jgi:hypothetical protein